MSYSRWGKNSCWYAWWQDINNCDELAFWYCPIGKNEADKYDVLEFRYEDIINDPKAVLAKLKEHTKCSAKNLRKAKKYIKEFIKDIAAERGK